MNTRPFVLMLACAIYWAPCSILTAAPGDPPPDPPGFHRVGDPGVSPRILAADPLGRFVIVQTNCETIAYNLQQARLKTWATPLISAVLSSDGNVLLTADHHKIQVWRSPTFDHLQTHQIHRPEWGQTGYYERPKVAVSKTGQLIAISNAHHAFRTDEPLGVFIYEAGSSTSFCQLPLPAQAYVTQLGFVGDDRLLVMFRQSGLNYGDRIQHVLCDVGKRPAASKKRRDATILHTITAGRAVRISQSQNRIATTVPNYGTPSYLNVAPSRTVTVRDARTAKVVAKVTLKKTIRDFALNPAGDRLLTAGEKRVVEYRVTDGTDVTFTSDESNHPFATVMYTPSGKRRLAAYEVPNGVDDDVDHFPCGWEVATNKPMPFEKFHFRSYNGAERLQILPAETSFVDVNGDSAIRDLFTNKELVTFPKYRPTVHEVAFTPDGEHMLVRNQLTDLSTGAQRNWHLMGANARFVENGRAIATADISGLYLADTIHGHMYWRLGLSSLYHHHASDVSQDAKRFVVSLSTNSLLHGDPGDRVLIIEPSRPNQPVVVEAAASAVATHPSQPWFVSVEGRHTRKRSLSDGRLIGNIWTTPGRVEVARFSPNGKLLLLGGAKGQSDLSIPLQESSPGWAAIVSLTDNTVVDLQGHQSVVTAGDFGPKSKRCATGSTDKTVRIWEAASGKSLHVYHGHRGRIHRLAYAPGGDRILTAAEDGAALLDVAGIVDRGKPHPPRLPPIKHVESVNAYRSTPAVQQLFPESTAAPLEDPSAGKAAWPVIELGDVSRISGLPPQMLAQAKVRHPLPLKLGPRRPPRNANLVQFEWKGASRTGRNLYLSFQKRKVAITDPQDKVVASWPLPKTYEDIQISPSGNEVLLTQRSDVPREVKADVFHLHVVDANSGAELRMIEDSGRVPHVSPTERTFFTVGWRGKLRLMDYQSGAELAAEQFRAGGPGIEAHFSPDGRLLATAKYPDTRLQIRDATNLKTVRTLSNALPIRWFTFSKNGDRVFVGQEYSDQRTMVSAWNVSTGVRIWRNAGPIVRGGVLADSGLYLSQPDYNTWSLWDFKSGDIKAILISESGGPRGTPVISHDGTSIHQGSPNGRQLWPITAN